MNVDGFTDTNSCSYLNLTGLYRDKTSRLLVNVDFP